MKIKHYESGQRLNLTLVNPMYSSFYNIYKNYSTQYVRSDKVNDTNEFI